MSNKRQILIGLGILVGMVACGSLVPRQGWSPKNGPVVPHDTFPADCSLCHKSGSWTDIREDFVFDHEALTGYALRGAHEDASCLMCHNDRGPAGRYAARGCAGCHEDPHRGRSGPDCVDCHNENDWRPIDAIRLHSLTRFPLVGPHAAAECFTCHKGAQVGNFEGLEPDCATCHIQDANTATDPDHIAEGLTNDCQQCHSQLGWSPARFDHPASFPLIGGHANVNCSACHILRAITAVDPDCASCHIDDYLNTVEPNHALAGFDQDCMRCHNVFRWGSGMFEHTPSFPLTNGHDIQDCAQCHDGGVFIGTPTDCVACHLDDYNSTISPPHGTSGFSTDCAECHDTTGWGTGMFEHPMSFPLTNGHAGHSCITCHTGGVLTGLSTDCVSCHLTDYNNTSDPGHAATGFSTDCMLCHDTADWRNAEFTHTPAFPLTGGHNGPLCTDCHTGGVYTGTSPVCVSCHLTDYNNTNDPDHAMVGFSTDCMLCHDTNSWGDAVFVHTPTFPLTGGHNGPLCTDCHTGGVYTGTPTDCAACHTDDYNATDDPDHALAGFSTDCALCHNTTNWGNANFTHTPSFPLTNGHNGPSCADCHAGNVFMGTPTDCVACHLDDYNNTVSPDHAASGISTDCADCHDTTGWGSGMFEHPMSFPLTNGHAGHACAACHTGGVITPLPTDCASCHIGDYNATSDPDHALAGFSTDCAICHDTTTWNNADFTHTPSFPLTGGHNIPSCTDCHTGGVYSGTSPDCVSCHLTDYNNTNDPDHAATGFGTDCMLCHDTFDWHNAVFNHPASFPLIGGHNGPLCTDCHTGGVYTGTSPDCVSCHLTDYNNTNDPNHSTSGFGTDCIMCHDVFDWHNASFNHPFPITTGAHRNLDCIDCHTIPAATPQFSCIDCHEHRQSSMDSKHHDVRNYVWESQACYNCHPNGRS
ncbi:MAG: hypothetical protein H6813_05210 [Phycisphaeraceae bacterium]|nr:hypothetical protein [Phycisphaeraceae bacterium]MCB9847782.1 hypothetical protein [Phycisphaeraceae bacterium]